MLQISKAVHWQGETQRFLSLIWPAWWRHTFVKSAELLKSGLSRMWMRQKTRREIRDQTAETQSLDKLTFKSDPPSLWKVCERKRIVRAQWVSGIVCFSICVQVRASVYSVRSRKPACTCLSERKRLSFTNTIPSLTLWGCSLLPPSRVGGRQAGRALLVLRRLDYGGHDHLLPRCGRVTGVTEILVLES